MSLIYSLKLNNSKEKSGYMATLSGLLNAHPVPQIIDVSCAEDLRFKNGVVLALEHMSYFQKEPKSTIFVLKK